MSLHFFITNDGLIEDQQDRKQKIGQMLNTDEDWHFVNFATRLPFITANWTVKRGDGES